MTDGSFATEFVAGELWEEELNGLTLRGRWIEHPDPNAPIVHFTHGNGFASDMYAPCLAPLLKYASLFTHDMQGHGLSDIGTSFAGLEQTADRIRQVLDRRGDLLKTPHRIAIAHSFGAIATLKCAVANPDLFDAVVLLDPVLLSADQIAAVQQKFDSGQPSSPLAQQALARGTDWPNKSAAFDYFNGRKSLSTWHPAGLEAYINAVLRENPDGSYSLRCPPWMEAAIFSQRPTDHWETIAALSTPTLVIYGHQSLDFIGPNWRQAASENANITAVGTEGGHCFTQEHPQSLENRLLAYPPVARLLNIAQTAGQSG